MEHLLPPGENTGVRRSAASRPQISIYHRPSRLLLAEGPRGWGITPFEGNYYVRRKYLRTGALTPNWIPGLCPYKGLYVWLDLRLPDERRVRNVGWLYWLPNPLLPFVVFRVAFDGNHPEVEVTDKRLPHNPPPRHGQHTAREPEPFISGT